MCLEQEVQMICIWSSCCHCHPIISCFIKIQIGLTVLVPAYPGCSGQETIKRVSVSMVITVTLTGVHLLVSYWLC